MSALPEPRAGVQPQASGGGGRVVEAGGGGGEEEERVRRRAEQPRPDRLPVTPLTAL